jgi:ketosteroid isomerase-like protein
MATLATLEKQEVEQFAREFERLFYQGDFVAMASYYTEDAQLLVEDQELIQGRPAISRFWQAPCQAANHMKRSIEVQEIHVSGTLGYLRGTVTLQLQEDCGPVTLHSFKYITIWKRETNGAWQLAVDISNRNPIQKVN